MSLLVKSLKTTSFHQFPTFFCVRCFQLKNRKKYVRRRQESQLNATGAYLKVLGSGAADQPASVLLQARDQRYLFNCGEGIGRVCTNAAISMVKVEHVFLTQSKWECIGGITSLIFSTIVAHGHLPIFHGPKNLFKIFQRMSFLSVVGANYKHRFSEEVFQTDERYEDHKIVIEPVELKYEENMSFVYVCKLKECKGGFSLEKSVDKDVPGHLLVQLFRGETVTLDNGTVVTPDEVRVPDSPDIYFVFLDIPNEGFLSDLTTNKKLTKVLNETKPNGVEVIIHFTPSRVFNTPKYQDFIEKIGARRHLMVNDSNKFTSMERLYSLQSKLNQIDSKIHPLPSMKLDTAERIFTPKDASMRKYEKSPTFFSKYILRELPKHDEEEEPYDESLTKRINEVQSMIEEKPELREKDRAPLKLKDEQFPRILFLGTGSADSYLLRNSSAILVHISKNNSILLDCGTATCSQINRFYGDEAPEIYRRINAVYISHMHLDHHIGLPELLRWRKLLLPPKRSPLRIFCPFQDLKSWMLFYANHVDPVHSDMKFIDNEILLKDNLHHLDKTQLEIKSLLTCPVEHFRKSYAMTLTFPYKNEGKFELFKLAYSGDTGPSEEFVKLGQNADLLIHEATFQDELIETATKHRHSTVSIAMEQSRQMQAKHTILTHFSSRYHILPYIGKENQLDKNTGIAFDYMEVTPSDLPRLNSLFDEYQKMFPEVAKKLQQKTRNYLIDEGWDGPMPFE